MGAGKSTVGAYLAKKLDWPFIDLDKEIEKSSGDSIHQIFKSRGEPFFRQLETEALKKDYLKQIATWVKSNFSNMNSMGIFTVPFGNPIEILIRGDKIKSKIGPWRIIFKTQRIQNYKKITRFIGEKNFEKGAYQE